MILAGVLLKMGGYGIIRICYPICPDAGYDLAPLVCGIGVVSMVYGAFAAMAQVVVSGGMAQGTAPSLTGFAPRRS